MKDITWGQIILALSALIGFLGGFLPLMKFLSEQWDKAKERRKAKIEAKIHDSVQGQEMQIKRAAQSKDELWDIINYLKGELKLKDDEIDGYVTRVDQLQRAASLSHPTITRLYMSVRVLHRQLGLLEDEILKINNKALRQSLEVVKAKLKELDDCLPK